MREVALWPTPPHMPVGGVHVVAHVSLYSAGTYLFFPNYRVGRERQRVPSRTHRHHGVRCGVYVSVPPPPSPLPFSRFARVLDKNGSLQPHRPLPRSGQARDTGSGRAGEGPVRCSANRHRKAFILKCSVPRVKMDEDISYKVEPEIPAIRAGVSPPSPPPRLR